MLLVDLTFASSALERNTYAYLDTQVLIEFGQAAESKDRDETVTMLNHREAISYLAQHSTTSRSSRRSSRPSTRCSRAGYRNKNAMTTFALARIAKGGGCGPHRPPHISNAMDDPYDLVLGMFALAIAAVMLVA